MSVLGLSAPRAQASQGIAEVLKTEKVLAGMLLRDGIISPDEVEIVEYGLENLGSSMLGLLITLVIGFCCDFLFESFLLWLLILPLRKNAGGFHAGTKGRCLLFSTAILLVSIICFGQRGWPVISYILIVVISVVVIFIMAPVENNNKHLDQTEQKVYRKRTRIVLLLECILFIFALVFNLKKLIVVLTIDFFIVSISLFSGRIKLQMM